MAPFFFSISAFFPFKIPFFKPYLAWVEGKLRSLGSMAEALGQSKLVAPCGGRRSASPLPKRKPSLVACRRSSSASPSFRSLSSSSLRRSGFLGEKLVFGDRRGEALKGRVDGLHVKVCSCFKFKFLILFFY